MNERRAYIALNMMEGIGPVTVRSLIDHLGSVNAIFEADLSQLTSVPGIGATTADAIISRAKSIDVDKEEESASRLGARIIAFSEKEYPEALKNIYMLRLWLYI